MPIKLDFSFASYSMMNTFLLLIKSGNIEKKLEK